MEHQILLTNKLNLVILLYQFIVEARENQQFKSRRCVMFNKAQIVVCIMLSFSVSMLRGDIIRTSWTGSDTDMWSMAGNWDLFNIPNNNISDRYFVTISTVERTRIVFTESITISQLDCYGDIDLEVGEYWLQITDVNDSSNKGPLINYGSLQISGAGVEHDIYANVVNTNDAEIFISNEVNFHGDFSNLGNTMIVPDGHFYCESGFTNSGNMQIYNGFWECPGNLGNNDTGVIQGSGMIHTNLSILNHGKIQAKGGSLVLHSLASLINDGVLENTAVSSLHIQVAEGVNNSGTIVVNAGGGVAFDCNLVNEPNAVITLLNGTLAAKTITQKAGATLKGFGGITGDIVIEPDAVVELVGPTNVVGNMTIGEGAVLDISNGTVLVTGDINCNNGIIQTTNGTFIVLGEQFGLCQRKFIDVLAP